MTLTCDRAPLVPVRKKKDFYTIQKRLKLHPSELLLRPKARGAMAARTSPLCQHPEHFVDVQEKDYILTLFLLPPNTPTHPRLPGSLNCLPFLSEPC